MKTNIAKNIVDTSDVVILAKNETKFEDYYFSEIELEYINKQRLNDKKNITINHFNNFSHIIILEDEKVFKLKEKARKDANKLCKKLNDEKTEHINIINKEFDSEIILAFIEGLMLSNYSFNKYFTKESNKKENKLSSITIIDNNITDQDLDKVKTIVKSVCIARDLVNEPYSSLNAVQLAQKIEELSIEAGFKAEILHKKQIETIKMGGLLAVNKASDISPTFSILEWKPENATNSKPLILVGKGVVFDSGGYSLKPGQYMEEMKSDMSGAAAVIGIFYAISKLNFPYHIIGLIPATDNLIGKNGYVPGDIISMHNGMTVEVLNTDAEGRLILADALSYAQKYEPELVIDIATLTGAAIRAVGEQGIAMFANVDKKIKKTIKKSGKNTYERIVKFPLWDEYKDTLKSKIADLKNIGNGVGHITAAKFLENFTNYPWIHLDIAPNAFLAKNSDYRGNGATGIPVRLLLNFIENYF